MSVKEHLGKNLKFLRKGKGISQEKLANQIEMSSAHYRSIEHGTANPSLKTLERIANGLDTSVSILVMDNSRDGECDDHISGNIV